MKLDLSKEALDTDFLKEVEEMSGQSISSCYQCGKCPGGCPVCADMTLGPSGIIRLVQLCKADEVLSSGAAWSCAGCQTCTSRCPAGIDVARVMDALRIIAQRRGVKPPPEAERCSIFVTAFLRSVLEYGRLSEVSLMGSYNVNSGRLWTNVAKAPGFLSRNKLSVTTHRIKNVKRLRRVFERIEGIEGIKI